MCLLSTVIMFQKAVESSQGQSMYLKALLYLISIWRKTKDCLLCCSRYSEMRVVGKKSLMVSDCVVHFFPFFHSLCVLDG
jgi:hypothetical protein